MDKLEMTRIPYFACEVRQGDNVVRVPIPYGALENMCRALLANNEGTCVCVVGISSMQL